MILEVDPADLETGDVVIRLKARDLIGCHCDVRVTVDRPGLTLTCQVCGKVWQADREEPCSACDGDQEEDPYADLPPADPCPDCGAVLEEKWSGVKCPKCPYWFCL